MASNTFYLLCSDGEKNPLDSGKAWLQHHPWSAYYFFKMFSALREPHKSMFSVVVRCARSAVLATGAEQEEEGRTLTSWYLWTKAPWKWILDLCRISLHCCHSPSFWISQAVPACCPVFFHLCEGERPPSVAAGICASVREDSKYQDAVLKV